MTGATRQLTLDDVRSRVEAVLDPELPLLTLAQLGIVRRVAWSEDAADTVIVEITPTYSGCPAMHTIAEDIEHAVRVTGHSAEVRQVLSPAWTTDWITAEGRKALQRAGIAPPSLVRRPVGGPVSVELGRLREAPPHPPCPQCGSSDVEELARFGSTSCKSLWRCRACLEPFDHLKPL